VSKKPSTGSAKEIVSSITDIATSVGALIAYLVALFGLGDTPYPKTTSLLTILATSILLINWRWAHIRRKRGGSLAGGGPAPAGSKAARKHSLLDRTLDPIKKNSRENYRLPLGRRRLEMVILLFLTVLTLGWSGMNFSDTMDEMTKDPALTCSNIQSQDRLLVVIADLLETNQQLLISDKIYDSMVSHQGVGQFNVCRLYETIKVNTEALEKAEEYGADIIIWGRSDVIYQIHLEAPALANPHRKLSELSSEEAASVEFQLKEPEHIAYVTQFVLSELFLLDGNVTEAQIRLANVLSNANESSLDVILPKDIADGYFLLGLFYDPGFSTSPDLQKSVDAYTEAILLDPELFAARLNRGLVLMELGRLEEAIMDFSFLIENDTPLKGSGYINRALLQNDPEAAMTDLDEAIKFDPAEGSFFRGIIRMNEGDFQGAIEDFKVAVKHDPQGFYNYHLLGQAQLYAGEYEAAQQTYTQIVRYLDEETRQQVIIELEQDAAYVPEIKPTVEKIIKALEAAQLS
jgi:tetratricopeptide (TPR) repeat protein